MSDAISILEAAYTLGGDERSWVTRLGEAVRRHVDGCHGVRVQTYDVTQPDVVAIREVADCGLDQGMVAAMHAKVALPSSEDGAIVPVLRRPFVGSLRTAPAVLERMGLEQGLVRDFERNLDRFFTDWKLADHWWINAQDPTGLGCLFVVPVGHKWRPRPRELHVWHCIAAHVAAAFRIRRQFAAWQPRLAADVTPPPEAVLRPDGKLEHAEPAAQDREARAMLRAGVLSLDRARGPLRERDAEKAVGIWNALVAGRWSLLDQFDSDGRRYVVAHRNDASVPDARGLTHRECQVLAHVELGHSNKMIAYELGLSTSTVAGHLASARAKLRLPSVGALRRTIRENARVYHCASQ